MYSDLTYSDAASGAVTLLTKGTLGKADVFIAHHRGLRFIVKDFEKKGIWERNFFGRFVIGREARAYRALAGIDGLPSQFKRLTPCSLAIEYLDGKDFGGIQQGEIGPGVVLQFERIVEDLHDRGWVHLDLQRRMNILLVNGKVYVVDLASAFHPGAVPVIGRCLLRMMSFFDRLSLIKLKKLYAPELITARERKLLKLRHLVMPTKW